MGTLTTRENVVLGSKLQLPTGKEPDLLIIIATSGDAHDDRIQARPISTLSRHPALRLRVLAGTAGSGRVFSTSLTTNRWRNSAGRSSTRRTRSSTSTTSSESSRRVGVAQLMLVAYTITDDVRRMTRWLRRQ